MATILILGDSTSMTVGLEKKSYVYLLAQKHCWGPETKIINSSQPGITAADASAFFFRYAKDYSDLKAVILYLGNCDANANELHKGRVTSMRLVMQNAKSMLGIARKKVSLRNKLMRFEWNDSYNPSLEQTEAISDYEYNLKRILGACRKKKIPVVLVRPKANRLFPAGVGKGNFIYYHYLPLNTCLASGLSHPDNRFLEAFDAYEKGDFLKSSKIYKEILEKPQSDIARSEYLLICAHNYALAKARQGKSDEALVLLELLMKEPAIRKEIVFFNKAFIFKSNGREEDFNICLREAYDMDSSMYRVKSGHIQVIDLISQVYQDIVHTVDMVDFKDDDFVDHCHLLPAAQEKLAHKVEQALTKAGVLSGSSPAEIKPFLLNLELALGNTADFSEYYRIYSGLTSEQIARDIELLRRDLNDGEMLSDRALSLVSDPVAKTVEYAKRHPCFADIRDCLRLPPETSLDVGRFPEYFVMRRLAPYLEAAVTEAPVMKIFSSIPGLIHSGRDLAAIIPYSKEGVDLKIPSLVSDDGIWMERIIENSLVAIQKHLDGGVRIHERLETTIFWYFREVLRWGSHSRFSMRYDRMTLEFIAEALLIASWINLKLNRGMEQEIAALAQSLVRVVGVHDKYCGRFTIQGDNGLLMRDYDLALHNEIKFISSLARGRQCIS